MSDNIHYEVQLAVASVGMGIRLMILYDLFHTVFWTGIEDFLYWIYCGFTTFNLLYQQNDGSLRAYVIAGVFLGMVSYQYLISQRMIKGLKKGQEYLRIKMKKHGQDSKQVKG